MEEKEFLSISKSVALKGILAVMVLVCHLHAEVDLFKSSILGTLFTAFGYLAVAGFFFVSGYGLTEQANKKGKEYAKSFVKRKILPFYLLCVFLIFIYLLRDLIIYKQVNLGDTLWSFVIGKTIVDKGWYLQVQLLMYLIFYLSIRFFDRKIIWGGVVFLASLIYIVVCFAVGLSSTWFEGVLCFSLGVIVSQNKEWLLSLFEKKLRAWLIALAIFSCFMVAFYFGNTIDNYYIRVFIKIVSCILFSFLAVLLSYLIKIENPVTKGIGAISLEIYVLQGLVLNLFSKTIVINNDILYIATVVILTVLLSLLFHPLVKVINRLGKRRENCNEAIEVATEYKEN